MIDCSVSAIKGFLESESIQLHLEKGTESTPIDTLVLEIGNDYAGRVQEVLLQIVKKKMLNTDKTSESPTKDLKFLSLLYFFPFQFKDEAVNDIARYILLINKTLEFSGFGLSEVDRLIFFRHDLWCNLGKVNRDLLKSFLGYVLLLADAFGPKFEQLASCEKSFFQIIEEAKPE